MVSIGSYPFLECSSRGDKRFSAFYANVTINGVTATIEAFYQSYKTTGVEGTILIGWEKNKGKRLESYGATLKQCQDYYRKLWTVYLDSNPHLVEFLKNYKGFTDIFGKYNNVCQAKEIYNYMFNLA